MSLDHAGHAFDVAEIVADAEDHQSEPPLQQRPKSIGHRVYRTRVLLIFGTEQMSTTTHAAALTRPALPIDRIWPSVATNRNKLLRAVYLATLSEDDEGFAKLVKLISLLCVGM